MKTILTIDFDILMHESIELYNNFAQSETWESKFKLSPLLQHLPIDGNAYQKLTHFLIKKIFSSMNKEKIHFLENHQDVLRYLSKDEQYNILNIDHHHDWCYADKDYDKSIEKLNCGNWVKYLNDNGQLASYTWINNANSLQPTHGVNIKQFKLSDCADLGNFSGFDEVFCILSPEYVPPYYHKMFFVWMDIANSKYETFFDLEV